MKVPPVNAIDAREELEAAIWRAGPLTGQSVAAILDAADLYAVRFASEVLDGQSHDRRTARRRAELVAGDGKRYGRTA